MNPSAVTSAWRDVVYKGNDNYYLEGTSDNGGRPGAGGTFGGAGAVTYGAAALAANTWTHLAVTYDRVTLRLYVNGAQVSSLGTDRKRSQLQRTHYRLVGTASSGSSSRG